MSKVLSELISLLALERLEMNLFRGQSQDLGWGRVFGGQVLGQSLSAAAQTVPIGRAVHSLHGYFLRPGHTDKPIIYDVDRIRDGQSFTTRRVLAIQGGAAIFSMSASFQVPEDGFDHADPMPESVGPDSLVPEHELAARIAHMIPEPLRAQVTAERPIEVRPVVPLNPLRPDVRPPTRELWYRTSGPLDDTPALHHYMLAYASDFNFLGTSMQPHGVSWLSPGMQVASLDHAMWFHRPFRFDEWLLYVIDSPSSSSARGFVRGRFFDQRGRLVASCAQEGLIRRHAPPSPPS